MDKKREYKAVVSDLDGTLLDENHDINSFTRETVRKIVEKGIKFYIATGRNYSGAKEVMEKINLKIPLITANGARILDSEGKEIYIKNLENEYLEEIYKIDYKKADSRIILNGYSGNDWLVVEDVESILKKFKPDRKIFPVQVSMEDFMKKKFTKIFFAGEYESLLKIEETVKNTLSGKVNVAFVSEYSLEIFPKDCDKSEAAKFLLEKDGLTLGDAVAFGDGANDCQLLEKAGKGYLMGNALHRLVERLPDFETVKSNAENGVALKLEELFL